MKITSNSPRKPTQEFLNVVSPAGRRHPEGGAPRRDNRLAQEDPGGHVHASVPGRPTREHGLAAAGVAGPKGRHGHHDPPPQSGSV